MSFSHYDEPGARTSHHTHCIALHIGARRATHCTTGDDMFVEDMFVVEKNSLLENVGKDTFCSCKS